VPSAAHLATFICLEENVDMLLGLECAFVEWTTSGFANRRY